MTQWDPESDEDAAFARLFASLPALQPSPAFVQATVAAAFEARARRQRAVRLAIAAAVLVTCGTTLVVAAFGVPQWVLLAAAQIAAGTIMAFVWATTAAAEFWSLMLRGGTVAARVAIMPQSVALLVATEVLGGVALYTLHHLLRSEIRFRNSGPLCI